MALSSVFGPVGSYLVVAVDSLGIINSPAWVGREQGVEVYHRLTALFEEGMDVTAVGTVLDTRPPDDVAVVVYAICNATKNSTPTTRIGASEIAQVLHLFGSTIVEDGTPAIIAAPYIYTRPVYELLHIPNHLAGVV